MRKKIVCIITSLLFATIVYGQISVGSFTMFPNRKLWGVAYKPNIALGKINNQYLLVLRYVSPTTYASFDEESILL